MIKQTLYNFFHNYPLDEASLTDILNLHISNGGPTIVIT